MIYWFRIKETVTKLRQLGVRVVMATGDFSITAVSVASQVGIMSLGMRYDTLSKMRDKAASSATAIVLNGSEIDQITSAEWAVICGRYTEIVLSQATPERKLKCVEGFQSNHSR